jgi:chromosome segregation ATPase
MSKTHRILAVLLVGLFLIQPAMAADKKKGKAARDMQRQITALKQQMEAEKAEMQAGFDKEKAELQSKAEQSDKTASGLRSSLSAAKKQNVDLGQALEVANQELDALRKDKAQLEAGKAQVEANLASTSAALSETRKTLADTQRDLKLDEAQLKDTSKLLTQRDNSLAACTEKNGKLYGLGRELVDFYDKRVTPTEPFTQLKRVQLENVLQDYHDKIEEQRVGLTAR